VAGRGEAKTRRLDRLPGENPGTEVRKTTVEAEAAHLLERSLGTLFYSLRNFPGISHPLGLFLPLLQDFEWQPRLLNYSAKQKRRLVLFEAPIFWAKLHWALYGRLFSLFQPMRIFACVYASPVHHRSARDARWLRIMLNIEAAKMEVVENTNAKSLDEKQKRTYNCKWVPRDPESRKKLSAKAMGSEQPGRSRRATIRKESRGTCRRPAHIKVSRQ
jgi:hypothetical protein